jgi:hypothetical protein
MSDLNLGLGKSNTSKQAEAYIPSRASFWTGFACVLFLLLVAEVEAVLHYLRHGNRDSGAGLLVLLNSLLWPLLPFVGSVGAYLQLKRYLSSLTDDPVALRTVAYYGLAVLGFSYLAINMILAVL